MATAALARSLVCRGRDHGLFVAEPVRSIHHHALPLLQAAIQDGYLSLRQCHIYGLNPGSRSSVRIGIDDPHIRSLHAALDGRGRHYDRIGPGFQHQVDIDELVGKQRLVLVVKDSLQLVGSRGGVDLVVGGEQQLSGRVK